MHKQLTHLLSFLVKQKLALVPLLLKDSLRLTVQLQVMMKLLAFVKILIGVMRHLIFQMIFWRCGAH